MKVELEKEVVIRVEEEHPAWNRRDGMPKVVCLPILLCSAILALFFIVKHAPDIQKSNGSEHLKFPRKLEDLTGLAEFLIEYKKDHPHYTLFLFSSAFLFKQTFAIPGSAMLNILAGALFGTWVALPLVSFLTAIGATFCFLLSQSFGYPLVLKLFTARLTMLRQKVHENQGSLFHFLLFARIFPLSPNWILNMASPFLGIPLHYFFLSVLLGLLPYNFLCVQAGGTLSDLKSISEVLSGPKAFALLFLASLFLIMGLVARRRSKQ